MQKNEKTYCFWIIITQKSKQRIANLPSNIEVMKPLNVNLETVPDKTSNSNIVIELCVVI